MKILVINAGSSSLKYQLLDPDTQRSWPRVSASASGWTAT